jgi:hypothetical protein
LRRCTVLENTGLAGDGKPQLRWRLSMRLRAKSTLPYPCSLRSHESTPAFSGGETRRRSRGGGAGGGTGGGEHQKRQSTRGGGRSCTVDAPARCAGEVGEQERQTQLPEANEACHAIGGCAPVGAVGRILSGNPFCRRIAGVEEPDARAAFTGEACDTAAHGVERTRHL